MKPDRNRAALAIAAGYLALGVTLTASQRLLLRRAAVRVNTVGS
jgi:hypothetical protein